MNRKARRVAAKQLRSADVKGTDETTTQVLIDQAVAVAQAGNWVQAEKILRHLLAVDANHPEALHLIGLTLGSTGRATEGIDFLKRATELKPGEALYWNNLSTCYMAAHRYAEAVEAARKAVILEPGYVIAWSRLGDVYGELKNFAKALEAYERAITLGETDIAIRKRMAVCLINIDRNAEAERVLVALREIVPDDADVLGNLGNVFVMRQNYKDAVTCLARSVEIDSSRASVVFNYARALAGAGELQPALRWARKTTSLDHRLVPAWLFLADLLLQSDELAEAKIAIKRAAELAPSSEAVVGLRQRLAQQSGTVDAAVDTGPVTWDFHLGNGQPMAPLVSGVDINAGKKAAAKEASTEPASKAESGIVDLTILKIG
ncbi:MAG: tetratricopeptide repeat protein [Proteobacteria bacterium]|nr:tetratricopeptide repeat protein [Pseudomonadota bacterium]